MVEYRYTIDMTPGREPVEIPLKQYDSDFTIIFALKSRNGEMTLESGTTVKIRGTKTDGTGYSVLQTLDLEARTVTVTGDVQMTAVSGRMPFELCLMKGDKEINTATFFLNVQHAAMDYETIPSENEIHEIVDVLENMEELRDETQAARDETIDLLDDVMEDLTQLYNYAITNTASGAIASFSDGSNDMPMESLVCHIEPYQEGSGDPSPTNVRAISGYMGLNAYARGFNLWDEEWELGYYNTTTGEKAASNSNIRCKNLIRVIPDTTYYLQWNNANSAYINLQRYDLDGNFLSNSVATVPTAFNVGDNVGYISFYATSGYGTTYKNDICINFSSDRNGEYEPYEGQTYSVDWQTEAGTVYGGTLDVVSGVLTVDRAIVDLGTLNWSYLTDLSAPRFWCALTNLKSAGSTKGTGDYILSPQHKSAPSGSLTYANYFNAISGLDGIVSVYTTGSNTTGIVIKDSSYTDAQTFKTAMSGVVCCYKLSAPTTYQLTPTEVKSLLGQNNIWHNCNGNTDAVYKADTKLYIDNKFAELQALILEN